jgi:HEAT repeat protein
LIDDTDVGVRTDAAVALGTCSQLEALQLLYRAEEDPSPSVRDAASRSIERISDRFAGASTMDPFTPRESK